MDQRRSKTIKRFIFIWVIAASFVLLSLTGLRLLEERNRINQKKEMLIMHPEQEVEIERSFDFYGKNTNKLFLVIGGTSVILAIISGAIVLRIYSKASAKEERLTTDKISQVILQLESFKKGDFIIDSQDFTIDKLDTLPNGELWYDLWEQIKELSYQVEGLKERLETEENSTKALISDISHQLKTPLASLRMSHELISSEGLSPSEKEEFSYKEELEIHRLEVLLQELMNLSRLENHMIQIHPAKASFKDTLTQCVNQVVMKALGRHIQLQVNMDEDIEVTHDPKWTIEALSNVLDNAIKYSPENTQVVINIQTLPNLVIMDVEDEGIGIPQEDLNKIFMRFYRGREASEFTRDGAGIGLYLSRKILEQQGGTIVAKRRPSGGTIFRITLLK